MTKQMSRVAQSFANDNEVMFLSHSVNPEYDNSAILKTYAKDQGADTKQWKFLTGDKNALYKMGRDGYFIDYSSNAGGNSEAFLHTENFVLVDKQGHIRGYYDGTDSVQVDELIRDIKLLKQYYAWKN
jgi:protein SCO1/2